MNTPYGARVRDLRTKRAWSQEELGSVADVSVRTIQRIEGGEPASFDTLKALANALDLDVRELTESFANREQPASASAFLVRIHTGGDLFRIVGGADAFGFDHDEFDEENDVEAVAAFLQELHDYADNWSEIGPAEHVRIPHQFTAKIKELENRGLWIFSMRHPEPYGVGSTAVTLSVAKVYITKATNPQIMTLGTDRAASPERPQS
jgi:transcriptional regulator with XRE-family HTH domain